jgi:hypothetical protein
MRVWVWQEAGAKVAASAGNGGDHLGGHDRVPTENFPLKGTEHDRWMIQTKLEANSPQFVEGVSALATAMALVRRDGSLEVEHWSQSVMIGPHEHDHGGATHEHPHGATT